MSFLEWINRKGDILIEAPIRLKKKKVTAISHSDIDRWLKSVDGLAKDLKALQKAKEKAQLKISKIGQKYKDKAIEREEKSDKQSEKDKDVTFPKKPVLDKRLKPEETPVVKPVIKSRIKSTKSSKKDLE